MRGKAAGHIRISHALGAVALLLVLAAALFWITPKKDDRKNILLIVADTLRADHLGCYGFELPTSPNIDRLAEEGTRFTRFYTVVPSTLASFMSLFTSLHPKDHGAFRNGFKADASLPVLAEVFREAGYETAAIIASFPLSAVYGTDRGFDYFDERYTKSNPAIKETIYRKARSVTKSFLQWAEERDEDKPFFTMVHYYDPHWPMEPPDQFMQMFHGRKMSEFKVEETGPEEPPEEVPPTGKTPNERELNYHKLYCAEIRYMDNQIGRILDYIDEKGLGENTLIVFTADHGETMWEHDDLFNHGLYVYDTTIHIPLVFHCPGTIPPFKVDDSLLHNLDLGPTLCEWAGIPAPSTFQGKSFAGLLGFGAGVTERAEPVFSEATMPYDVEKNAPRPNRMKAKCIRLGDWKYIDYPSLPGRRELYNMAEDPMERDNLVSLPERAKTAKELSALLEQWADRYQNPKRQTEPLGPEDARKLKELGY